jgi:hypothetical protein
MTPLLYRVPVANLTTGSSLGNPLAFARLDASGNCHGLWSASDNRYYAGSWLVEIVVDGEVLTGGETLFAPESQTTIYKREGCVVEKLFLLPFLPREIGDTPAAESRAAIVLIRVERTGGGISDVRVRHTITFPAVGSALFTKQPLQAETEARVAITHLDTYWQVATVGVPTEARVFGSPLAAVSAASDDRSLSVEYALVSESGATDEAPFVLTFSPDGIAEARRLFVRCRDYGWLLRSSREAYEVQLARTRIVTPDPVINRGLQWAKVNMLRVQHRYRLGMGFTNDPPQDIIVIRDLAWYVLGSDYLTPGFSRGLIQLAERFAYHEGGKLTEYLHADEDPPVRHDYELNINDDTPLFVWALFHHAAVCGGEYSFARVYPLMKRACDWILGQREDGLIRCSASGTSVRGICSWRNIIEGYTLSGAVTEVNAECAFALALTADVAGFLGYRDEREHYQEASLGIREAMNTLLLSEKTGMFLLTLANDGTRHHDVTGDLIFPVMFGVADGSMRHRIIKRLTDAEMWTPYGSRTVSGAESNYDPDFGYQLVGGVWPNLTAWIAYCVRRDNPAKLVEGMRNIYALSETARPIDFGNVVPGQFPERLHGVTYFSRGMTMSPWTPPTYLWLGVEGLMGVEPTGEGLRLNPAIPASWEWAFLMNMPFRDEMVTAVFHRGEIYCSCPLESDYPVKVGNLLPVSSENAEVAAVAFRFDTDISLFVGGDRESETKITIQHSSGTVRETVKVAAGGVVHKRYPGVCTND